VTAVLIGNRSLRPSKVRSSPPSLRARSTTPARPARNRCQRRPAPNPG